MKKAVIVLLVGFGLFWMVTDPRGLAESAQTASAQGADLTADLFTSVIAFVRELDG